MRLMADIALSLGVRFVIMFEFFRHLCVAAETESRGTIFEQRSLVCCMRVVATQTLSLFNWHMHKALALFIGRIGVTGVAQVLYLLLKQTAEFGDMGVMTGKAISIRCRLMIHPFLKNIAFMA